MRTFFFRKHKQSGKVQVLQLCRRRRRKPEVAVGGSGCALSLSLSYFSALMASDESDVEWQTGEIVKGLLENADEAERKSLELDVNMSPDKPTGWCLYPVVELQPEHFNFQAEGVVT